MAWIQLALIEMAITTTIVALAYVKFFLQRAYDAQLLHLRPTKLPQYRSSLSAPKGTAIPRVSCHARNFYPKFQTLTCVLNPRPGISRGTQ